MGYPEIANLNLKAVIVNTSQENILTFDVPVQNSHRLQIMDAQADLNEYFPD